MHSQTSLPPRGRRPRFSALVLWSTAIAGVALHGGCSSLIPPAVADPTRYYVLTTPGGLPAGGDAVGRWTIGVRSLELPGYLRTTKSVVVRSGLNEIRYQEFARWAEPLDAGLTRVVRETLLASPRIAGVETAPMRSDQRRDFDVVVRVVRCEGGVAEDGRTAAQFSVVYDIVAADGTGRLRARKTFTAPEAAWDGKDIAALAKLLSEAAARLAEQIAADLGEKPAGAS